MLDLVRLLAFVCFALLTDLAAQQNDAGEPQVISGSLVATGPRSISIKLNDKITAVKLVPDSEIWRRGIDFTSASNLLLGDDIYVLYSKMSPEGEPVASLVAAAEEGDSVTLVSRHVVEDRVCGGILTALNENTIAIKNDEGTCTMRLTPDTVIWRGETFHNAGNLMLGDDIAARAQVNYASGELVAESVEANITKVMGAITKVGTAGIEVADEDEQGDPNGRSTVFIDDRTIFDDGAPKDLRVGAFLEVIGLDLGHDSVRATRILSLRPADPSSSDQQ